MSFYPHLSDPSTIDTPSSVYLFGSSNTTLLSITLFRNDIGK